MHITCQCITLNGKSWSEESWLPNAILLRPVRAQCAANGLIIQGVLRAHCAAKLADPQPKGLVPIRNSAHLGPQQRALKTMAAQPATADWEWNYYHDYSVRVKNLPPVYATKKSQAQPQPEGDAAKLHESTNRVGPDH